MAAITRVYTISYVAEMLGEDEDWLWDIHIEMEPEDGVMTLYAGEDLTTTVFTDFGIENLQNLIEIYKGEMSEAAEKLRQEKSRRKQ